MAAATMVSSGHHTEITSFPSLTGPNPSTCYFNKEMPAKGDEELVESPRVKKFSPKWHPD